jgi:hypothetical protein
MTRRGELVRVIIPDSHGVNIDPDARKAFLGDLKRLDPHQIIGLGDHVDVGGKWGGHPPLYSQELEYSIYADYDAGNDLLDKAQAAAPRATWKLLEGNHEQHIDRWAARFLDKSDVSGFVSDFGPYARLKMKERGIKYFSRADKHQGLSLPNTIFEVRNGIKCYFTHGTISPKNAASAYLAMFGDNVVFGHTHTAQSYISNTLAAGEIGAWCPATLAKKQPYYLHTSVSKHTLGYGLQIVQPSGVFITILVAIVDGKSTLPQALRLAA